MIKLHHATVARATKLGVSFLETEGVLSLVRTEDGWKSEETWTDPKLALADLAEEEVTFLDPAEAEEEEDEDHSRKSGVMPIEYHKLYMANGGGCGDTLDAEMREVFLTPGGVDTAALRLWGELLGLWNPAWEVRNPGMQRMNLANRVRGWLRQNEGEVPHPAGGEAGTTRFGIGMKPRAARKSRAKAPKAEA